MLYLNKSSDDVCLEDAVPRKVFTDIIEKRFNIKALLKFVRIPKRNLLLVRMVFNFDIAYYYFI